MDAGSANHDIELYMLRHAHAGNPAEWSGDDAARPLSQKGRRQAQRLGQFLLERRFNPDAIVTSPKLRARQTAELVADALGIGVTIDDRLAGPLDLDVVAAIADAAGGTSLVIVGHDPDFSELAGALCGAAYLPLKKGAMARIDVSLPIQDGGGILRWLVPPELLLDQA